jgi:hypothetical protein
MLKTKTPLPPMDFTVEVVLKVKAQSAEEAQDLATRVINRGMCQSNTIANAVHCDVRKAIWVENPFQL